MSEFSSGRAMAHLAAIAKKPHPAGSPEHENVASYIIQELTAMGLRTEKQDLINGPPNFLEGILKEVHCRTMSL